MSPDGLGAGLRLVQGQDERQRKAEMVILCPGYDTSEIIWSNLCSSKDTKSCPGPCPDSKQRPNLPETSCTWVPTPGFYCLLFQLLEAAEEDAESLCSTHPAPGMQHPCLAERSATLPSRSLNPYQQRRISSNKQQKRNGNARIHNS